MPPTRFVFGLCMAAMLAAAAPCAAQPVSWRQPAAAYGYAGRGDDPREGMVNVSRYVAKSPNIGALGHGRIMVAQAPGTMAAGLETATYEAAVVDQLAKAGYDTNAATSADGQVAELVITHDVVQPEEPLRSPVSGEVAVGVGNRGSTMGLGLNVDFTKPLKALIATRLDASIRDKATHELLWEGHAELITRDGDKHWSNQAIAARLAAALFRDFPRQP